MNTETLKRAVELAEGWSIRTLYDHGVTVETKEGYGGALPGSVEILDALAAQLVRQVRSLGTHTVRLEIDDDGYANIWTYENGEKTGFYLYSDGKDDTENTINACVEFFDD